MDFVLNKVSYFKTIRADQNITRKNFETQYTVKKAVQEGDFCTIYINEFISFQYENRNTPSYVSTDYEVYLYQYNGEWLIANVIADDEFDRNFRAYGFDATETIFYKGIMPSEKILDLPVDCNTLTGCVNL